MLILTHTLANMPLVAYLEYPKLCLICCSCSDAFLGFSGFGEEYCKHMVYTGLQETQFKIGKHFFFFNFLNLLVCFLTTKVARWQALPREIVESPSMETFET